MKNLALKIALVVCVIVGGVASLAVSGNVSSSDDLLIGTWEGEYTFQYPNGDAATIDVTLHIDRKDGGGRLSGSLHVVSAAGYCLAKQSAEIDVDDMDVNIQGALQSTNCPVWHADSYALRLSPSGRQLSGTTAHVQGQHGTITFHKQ